MRRYLLDSNAVNAFIEHRVDELHAVALSAGGSTA